jgi:uncharacterized membrane protein
MYEMSLFQIGKYLFATIFLVFGAMHFMAGADMAGMVPAFVPGGVLWVYLTGLAMIAYALAIYTGRYAKLASQLLALLLVIFAVTIHIPAVMGGDQMSMSQVLKDLGLAGGALVLGNNYTEGPGL